MDQIEMINHLQKLVIFSYLRPHSFFHIIYITQEYLFNRIIRVKKEYLDPFNCVKTH